MLGGDESTRGHCWLRILGLCNNVEGNIELMGGMSNTEILYLQTINNHILYLRMV